MLAFCNLKTREDEVVENHLLREEMVIGATVIRPKLSKLQKNVALLAGLSLPSKLLCSSYYSFIRENLSGASTDYAPRYQPPEVVYRVCLFTERTTFRGNLPKLNSVKTMQRISSFLFIVL